MALQITITEERGVVVLHLVGRIDSFSIEELNAGFEKVMKTGRKSILLVLKDLEYINSRGMGVLISFLKWVKKVGGLVKIAEVPLNIMQLLNLLGLDGLTLIYDSTSDAFESFRRQQATEAPREEPAEAPAAAPIAGGRPKTALLLVGFCGLLLLAAIALLLKVEGRGAPGVDLGPLEKRLTRMEERLGRLEIQGQGAQQVEKRVQDLVRQLSGRVDELAREVEKARKGPESVKPPEDPPARKEQIQKRGDMRSHWVRPGESLIRIARRYGITLAELCRLNRLDPKAPIRPGQKLLVGPSDSGG
ncbi:MAG: STAS domain-containing protein [Thermodesulfobacteriota bacterium]